MVLTLSSNMTMELLVLLYAHDTVVFGTDEKDFQNNYGT